MNENDDSITFPNFWIFRSEDGWRWVSNDATKSSRTVFEYAPFCALNAERTLRPASGDGK